MAYNNNYKPVGNWNQQPQQRSYAPYNRSYGKSNNGQGGKKSGSVYTKIRKGKHEGLTAENAWRKTRNGLMTASAMPVDGVVHKGQRNDFMRYAVNVINQGYGTTQTYWCLMNVKTQTIVIKELGLVISPNGSGRTASGKNVRGYFGKFTKS